MYSPHIRTSRTPQSVLDPNEEFTHGTMTHVVSEIKRMSGIMGDLITADAECTQTIEKLLDRIGKLEERLVACEDADGEGVVGTKRGRAVKSGSNDHPSLKVRQRMLLL
jgi:hypothetical protein